MVRSAQRVWTEAAFQEHRTGAACAATLKALIAARAPLDLIAMACRFPLDEMAHVEMCARLVGELGGAVKILHDPKQLVLEPTSDARALMQAAELVVNNFCVGEALSIPVLRGSWHAAQHPLVRTVLARIVKDEAAHGQFGWLFLDWAVDELTDGERRQLAKIARASMELLWQRWRDIDARPKAKDDAQALGWMESNSYLTLCRRSMQTHVIEPLQARGIDPMAAA